MSATSLQLPPIGNPDAARLAALARHSAARRAALFPRRALSRGTNLLMWLLRFYVLVMLAIVALQIAGLA